MMPWLSLFAVLGLASATVEEPLQSAPNCPPVPVLIMDPNDSDWPESLREGGTDNAIFTANFAIAYERVCNEGLLGERGLQDRAGVTVERFYVYNVPDANDPYIGDYPEGERGFHMEGPFFRENEIYMPDADLLHYALECWLRPATEAEVNETGRCLLD